MAIDAKKVIKNAWRITKDPELSCLRIRVPGGHLPVKYLSLIQEIADRYGNGTVHITTRQGFEIPGIPFKYMDEVNAMIEPILEGLEISKGVKIDDSTKGYPAAGTRNVCACIGERVCPKAAFDTTALAWEVERTIYPNDYHVKIAITGCPNDCVKAHTQDIGIIGQIEPVYEAAKCVGCRLCVKKCPAGALTWTGKEIVRDADRCIGCGDCADSCPKSALSRGEQYFRVVIMGRTGKKNPRMARTFLQWVDRDTVLKLCRNLYSFIDKYINKSLPKEHVGYIFDRTGLHTFKEEVLKGVTLSPKAKVVQHIEFGGYTYKQG
ncbi:sulfite reductase, subunit C [Desulfotomaculum nigrificans CO-1-SRB]|uniref:Sulfite reductase, subunit C n=1 Tax=Desulfotomaculum nigrificans (strain DSM 14880 / VKM B-2319 / CO-1-SRB) TaxID=868595 RepID=F6B2Q6_DESCC|nr:sulfite reductase subunit C [Desulfotomaculum nigrificans]AEF93885.1 sulfite reductase, subunit C [Desulfotomaculum nigrificans CO-1-SRB]